MKSMRQGPPEILANICINAQLINTPALGDEDNVAYTSTQLNIAPAEEDGSGKHQSSPFPPGLSIPTFLHQMGPLEGRLGILEANIGTPKTTQATIPA
jgi:hypothetical protein